MSYEAILINSLRNVDELSLFYFPVYSLACAHILTITNRTKKITCKRILEEK